MQKTLILLAGYPATGKSDLAGRIQSRHPEGFVNVSIDDIKEQFWDTYGFNNEEEKLKVNADALQEYFNRVDKQMQAGVQIMSDYPFSDKQKEPLAKLAEKNGYRILTVRLVGDCSIIIARSQARDLSQGRHLGHVVSCYHKGDVLEDRSQGDDLVDLDLLIERCVTKGYGTFELGHTIEVDATILENIDYPKLLAEIDAFLDDPDSIANQAAKAGEKFSDDELVSRIDYTLLKPYSTWEQIKAVCAEAAEGGCASACIPPSFVKQAASAFPELPICTVIGFPLGYSTSAAKAQEAADAVANGAAEIDMVINQGMVRERDFDGLEADIRAVRDAIPNSVLKVIVETCYLPQETKEEVCKRVIAAGADYIKTSTGFGSAGAQLEDVALFARVADGRIKVKAAGGIRDRAALAAFAGAGADRVGCSAKLSKLFG